MTTIVELTDRVHSAAIALGMDVSPKDVAFIISTFLESLAQEDGSPADANSAKANAWLLTIADEVNSTKDE